MRKKVDKRRCGNRWMRILLLGPVLTLALAMLGAKLIVMGWIAEDRLSMIGLSIMGIVGLVLGLLGAIQSPQKKLLWGTLAAAITAAGLLLGNLLFFGVGYCNLAAGLGTTIGSGVIGALLGSGRRKKYT